MRAVSEFDMTVRLFLRHGIMLLGVVALAACSSVPPSNVKANAKLSPNTKITRDLTQLPEPRAKVPVAVYSLRDQTGQYKNSPDSPYSTQVTQGAATMLINALRNSGWYMPVEREGLQNLLTERRIVRAIESPSDKGKPIINLPNLMPASLIIEGGIIAYESNVRTGGKGANYLGIGASTQYRVDQVTASLRSIDIRSGQVLNTVSVTKTIYSYQFSANVYAYVAYQKLLQGETGFTTNEPAQLAVREALESAVIHLTVQSVHDRILELKNEQDWASPIIQAYLREGVTNIREEDLDEEAIIPMLPMNADLQSQMVVPLVVDTPKPEPVRMPEPVATLVEPPVVAPVVVPQSRAEGAAAESEVKPLTPVKKPADDIFKSYWGDKVVKPAIPVKPAAQLGNPVPVKPVVMPQAVTPSAIVAPPVVPAPAVPQSALQTQPVPQVKANSLQAEQAAKDESARLKVEQQAKAVSDAQDKKAALAKAKQDARDAKAAQLRADNEAKAEAERVKAEQSAKAAADAKAANVARAQAAAEEKAAKAKAQQEAKVEADRLKAEQQAEASRLKQEQVARAEALAQEKKSALAKAKQDARDAKAAQIKADQLAKAEAERVKAEQVAAEAQARNAARVSGQSAAQQFDNPVLVQPSANNPSALAMEALPEDPSSPRATETRNFLKSSLSGKKRVKQAKSLKNPAPASAPVQPVETPAENSVVEQEVQAPSESVSQTKSSASTKAKSSGDIFRTYWELN
jgi:curli production assembly/transport component CsgG